MKEEELPVYNQIYYNDVIYKVEQMWNRKIDEHERHTLLLGYRIGRQDESENEIQFLFAK